VVTTPNSFYQGLAERYTKKYLAALFRLHPLSFDFPFRVASNATSQRDGSDFGETSPKRRYE